MTADDEWKHERELKAALDKLGYEPKENGRRTDRFLSLLMDALRERDLDPHKLAQEQDAKRQAEAAQNWIA